MGEIDIIRESAIPLHVQLQSQLRHLILSGKWAPNARIPSEPALQRQLNISRSTIRQALKNAEAEGLITRVPGKGTFVAAAALGPRSHLIGYVTDNCGSGMQSQVLTGAESVVATQGYRIIFGNSASDVQEEDRALDQLVLEDNVAGILVWPAMRDEPSGRLLQLARQGTVPMVVVDRTIEGLECDCVTSENYAGASAAVKHLLELGHRRIVLVSRPILHLSTLAERYRGYRDAMRKAGLSPAEPWLVGASDQELTMSLALEKGSDAHNQDVAEIVQRFKADQPPTAIFAINDVMAMVTIKAAREAGLEVPRDLSLVGFDDVAIITSLFDVPLTTVAQDPHAMGERAAALLLERMQGCGGPAREELLPTQLRVRATTAAPRRKAGEVGLVDGTTRGIEGR